MSHWSTKEFLLYSRIALKLWISSPGHSPETALNCHNRRRNLNWPTGSLRVLSSDAFWEYRKETTHLSVIGNERHSRGPGHKYREGSQLRQTCTWNCESNTKSYVLSQAGFIPFPFSSRVDACVFGTPSPMFASAQIAHKMWPLQKFPVHVCLFELQSITSRYPIHPNRCCVLNDTGLWQPATDAGMKDEHKLRCFARTHKHKYTHMSSPQSAVITRI